MAFLRIAAFEVEHAPDEAVELWDDLMGSALRNHPDCLEVTAARQDDRFAVVSKWVSEDAFRAAAASKPLMDLVVTIAARFGLSPDQEPSFLFEGELS